MDKQKLLDALLKDLKSNLDSLVEAAFVAKEAATSEESKAENKYDTRGLEASYLAGAQAKRAEEFQSTIYKLQKLNFKMFDKNDVVTLSAIVKVVIDGEAGKYFFLLPAAGGQKLTCEGETYHVITPESPVGRLFLGKKINDIFSVKTNLKEFEYEIVGLY